MRFKADLDKQTDPTIIAIGNYLLSREDIKDNLEKENKSLKEMFEYIMSEAERKMKNGIAIISDNETFGMAVHYYDEDEIKFKKVNTIPKVNNPKEIKKSIDDDIKQNDKPALKTNDSKGKNKNNSKNKNAIVEDQLSMFDIHEDL